MIDDAFGAFQEDKFPVLLRSTSRNSLDIQMNLEERHPSIGNFSDEAPKELPLVIDLTQ